MYCYLEKKKEVLKKNLFPYVFYNKTFTKKND